jgi:hypothetical protein
MRWNIAYIFLTISLLAMQMSACQQASPKTETETQSTDCRYGKPGAIFSSELEGVATHQFEAKGQDGREAITFSNGQRLEIYQSGCNNIRQEFRFPLPVEEPQSIPDSIWLKEAVGAFFFMASMGPQYQPLSEWGRSLDMQDHAEFRLGKPHQVEPGFYATVDRIPGVDSTTLLVVLEQSSE